MSEDRLPKTAEEFKKRYLSNQWVEGEDTNAVTHMPCSFCGAPDLILLHALNVAEDLTRGGTCKECGRGIRVIFDELPGTEIVNYEVVQTIGLDPPEYISPWPRRDT